MLPKRDRQTTGGTTALSRSRQVRARDTLDFFDS
jgi:hypothetical protein